jgi:hypothetical protein
VIRWLHQTQLVLVLVLALVPAQALGQALVPVPQQHPHLLHLIPQRNLRVTLL